MGVRSRVHSFKAEYTAVHASMVSFQRRSALRRQSATMRMRSSVRLSKSRWPAGSAGRLERLTSTIRRSAGGSPPFATTSRLRQASVTSAASCHCDASCARRSSPGKAGRRRAPKDSAEGVDAGHGGAEARPTDSPRPHRGPRPVKRACAVQACSQAKTQ